MFMDELLTMMMTMKPLAAVLNFPPTKRQLHRPRFRLPPANPA
jgi:hypothetical protein